MVKRIDEGLGLVLELPSEPTVSPGFMHISNIADTKIDKLQQVRQSGHLIPAPLSAGCCRTGLVLNLPSL